MGTHLLLLRKLRVSVQLLQQRRTSHPLGCTPSPPAEYPTGGGELYNPTILGDVVGEAGDDRCDEASHPPVPGIETVPVPTLSCRAYAPLNNIVLNTTYAEVGSHRTISVRVPFSGP